MKLTESNFRIWESGSGYKLELANSPMYTNPWSKEECKEIIQRILKNQEDAEKWEKLMLHLGERSTNMVEVIKIYNKILKILGEEK